MTPAMHAVFLIDCPTPQRAPLLDILAEMKEIELLVVYRQPADTTRGWGDVPLGHRHNVLSGTRVTRALDIARVVLDPACYVVCCFGYRYGEYLLAIALARVRRVPLVMRTDSNDRDEESRVWTRRLVKRLALRCLLGKNVCVWTIGTANERYWRRLGMRQRVRIPYTVPSPPVADREAGLALRRLLGLVDSYVVLYVGRLERSKGIWDLVDAFAFMRTYSPKQQRTLLVAGSGTEAAQLCSRTRDASDIVTLGAVPYWELGKVYQAADVLVVPSHAEAWGLVVNEALANGLPVIASDRVGSAEDLLTDVNGLTYSAGDVAGLVRCLEQATSGRLRRFQPRLCVDYDGVIGLASELSRVRVLRENRARRQ